MVKKRRDTNASLFFSYDKPDENGVLHEHYCRAKASIRGNDVYRARVWNRHKPLLRFCEVNKDISYIIPSETGFTSNILKATLTVDINKFDLDEYNTYYSNYHYDLFIKRLRNEFPGVVVAKTLEISTQKAKGFIHINVILIVPNTSFHVYLHTSRKTKNGKGEYVKTWRLQNYSTKSKIDDMWDCGFVDIRAVQNPTDLAEYAVKYSIKTFTNEKSSATQDLTLSALSLFNKRSYSFPNASATRGSLSFCDTLIDYTVGLDNPDPVLFPRLDIIMHNSLDYSYIGYYVDFSNEYDPKTWIETLDKPPDDFATDEYIQLVIESESKNMTVPEYIRFLEENK